MHLPAATFALLAASFLLPTGLLAQERLLQPEDLPARRTAAAVLGFGVASWRELGPEAGGERLVAAIATARQCLPDGSSARVVADELAARHADASTVRATKALIADLTFEPLAEAALPEGLPGFQALDELELRHYPGYRMVRTGMKGGTMGAFWPLFTHIKEHEIAMTTPVQIDYGQQGERLREVSMAFLYGSPALGEAGADGKVEVVDVPATVVLTIGSRGYDRPARVAELRARIDAWLAQHPEWQAAGEMRTMGYNSPSVAAERRYFEVQLPVQPRQAAKPGCNVRESV